MTPLLRAGGDSPPPTAQPSGDGGGWRSEIGVLVIGAVVTAVTAAAMEVPGRDTPQLLALAAGGALAAGLLGAAVLRAMRTGSLRAQSVAVALVAVFGTAVGVVLAAGAMFVSSQDLGALLVVLSASATVAVALAVRLGSRIGTTSRTIEDLARRLGAGDLITVDDAPVAQELRRLMIELGEASRRLDEARSAQRAMEEARRVLIAGVSHDLRTPLAGIRAMVEAIEDGVVDDADDIARYHRTIGRETERLAGMVDDLFELSRIEAGAIDLRTEPISVGELVAEAVAAVTPLAETHGVMVTHAGGADPMIDASPQELVRVVRNLLDNAVRHTATGGTVEVRCEEVAGRVQISILDACGGIPVDDIDRVFDLAFRGDASRTRVDNGTGAGIGLAIAKGLVDLHGGTIGVVNEDPGCRFTIGLPARSPV